MSVIQINSLTKKYGNKTVLSDISCSFSPGHIYGVVGNNGAGKTTLFRIIAGLVRPTSGSFSIFDETTKSGLRKSRKRIGFLIEDPFFYPNINAFHNLEAVQILYGPIDKMKISAVLKFVGLDPDSRQKLHSFSLGMKQRYGVALTLIHDPDILVLDEPLNGLDPSGSLEINSLIKQCCQQGKTVIMSSHLLAELSKTATDYLFMDHGQLLEQLTYEELVNKCNYRMNVRCSDPNQISLLLQSVYPDCEFEFDEGYLIVRKCHATIGEVNKVLANAKLEYQIETSGTNLEDYFFTLLDGCGS